MELKRQNLSSQVVLDNTDEDDEALSINMAFKSGLLERYQVDYFKSKSYNRVVVGPTFIYATVDFLNWDEYNNGS